MADDSDSVKPSTDEGLAVAGEGVVAAGDLSVNSTTQEESKLQFSADEETLIIRMHSLVGERWSLIAGRIPGRSAEEIEKYWNSKH